jgi:hypothetical protein
MKVKRFLSSAIAASSLFLAMGQPGLRQHMSQHLRCIGTSSITGTPWHPSTCVDVQILLDRS